MAAESKPGQPENVPTALKSDTANNLDDNDVASSSGKDGIPSDSSSSVSSSGNANASVKVENNGASIGDHGVYNSVAGNCNYYYPGYNGPFAQLDDHVYFQADSSAVQSDSSSLVYFMPGYNPYASGTLLGVDGQSVSQQPYFPSGYLQHHVSYGSEAVPCYSWDSTYVSDVPNGNISNGNGQYGSGSSNFTKSNGSNSMKANGSVSSKFSKSTYTRPFKPLNKVSPMSSDFSAGLLNGYQSTGKFPSFTGQRQGPVSYNGSMNYRENGRMWNANNRNRSRDKYQRNGNMEMSSELTCGPRASKKNASPDAPENKEEKGVLVLRDKYNLSDFKTEYVNAKFFVIKSYNEDDIHKSIKYDVWASTPNGNKKLDAAFCDAEERSTENGTKCPIFLFFSVNGSGQFVGLAEMVGQVDFNKDMNFWQLDKWNGFFPVRWHIIKDIPNNQLRHIILENNESKPVTFSRDTQEIGLKQGLEMLNIFQNYAAKSSLLDDFTFYEDREKSAHLNKTNKPGTLRLEINENSDMLMQTKAEEKKFAAAAVESRTKKTTSNTSSLINLTKNLSLNGYTPKNSTVKRQIENSIPSVPAP